jgi:hypothetical protein
VTCTSSGLNSNAPSTSVRNADIPMRHLYHIHVCTMHICICYKVCISTCDRHILLRHGKLYV